RAGAGDSARRLAGGSFAPARSGSPAARALRRQPRELLPPGRRVPPLGHGWRAPSERRGASAHRAAHDRRDLPLRQGPGRPGRGGRVKRAPLETPRLLLGTESLLGFTRAPRDRLLQVTARFAEPESLAVTFSKAIQLGADGG